MLQLCRYDCLRVQLFAMSCPCASSPCVSSLCVGGNTKTGRQMSSFTIGIDDDDPQTEASSAYAHFPHWSVPRAPRSWLTIGLSWPATRVSRSIRSLDVTPSVARAPLTTLPIMAAQLPCAHGCSSRPLQGHMKHSNVRQVGSAKPRIVATASEDWRRPAKSSRPARHV